MSLLPGYSGPMTEHEAVNVALIASLLPPLPNALNIDQNVAAASAWRILMAESRIVQAQEWHFNRSFNRRFDPIEDGTIPAPDGLLMVVFDGGQYVVRSNKIFDRYNSTFVIGKPVVADEVVELLLWDDLPIHAQNYIAQRAARIMAVPRLGAQDAKEAVKLNEQQALVALEQADAKLDSPNAKHHKGTMGKWSRHK